MSAAPPARLTRRAEFLRAAREFKEDGSSLTAADLAGYQPKKRVALCTDWRAQQRDWRLCGFPPPSSGAIAVGQILGILAHTPAPTLPLQDGLRNLRQIAEGQS